MNRVSDVRTVSGMFCIALAMLAAGALVHLARNLRRVQVDSVGDYNYAASVQSMRRVQTAGLRGRILDRRGEILADNRRSLSIVCDPIFFQAKTWSGTAEAMSNAIVRAGQIIGVEVSVSERTIRRHVNQALALPLTVWRDIGQDVEARFCEHGREMPGFRLVETAERTYPFGSLAAHALGFVGRAEALSEAGDEKFTFRERELYGREGLERYYDGFLRGMPGEAKILVDARGFAIREWTVVSAQKGPDLQLALDVRVQRAVEEQLKGVKGACVVMDPRNGEILALASSPTFDLRECVPILRTELYELLAKDEAKPLLNRATSGAYAPGSTFKPVVALAGLSHGLSESKSYPCTGVYQLGDLVLRCAARWGHGELDLRHALMKSCNPYFCNLGVTLGTNTVIEAARAFGLGEKSGIDLFADFAGVVPEGEWKKRMYGEPWYLGDLAQMSIGQGMLMVSPVQMARIAGALGMGYLVTPHLKLDAPFERRRLPFNEGHLALVQDGMRMVVAGEGGEHGGGRAAGEGVGVAVAGKTGTAEVGQGAKRRKNTWFIGYAPVERPTVAVALVVEDGESGGGTAAPRVGAVLRTIFGGGGEA